HGAAYQFWVSGDYKSSQYLCQPVAAITRAFLDDDSAVVADTNYYLAETLRCQGKLEAARLLYEKVLETFEKDIGKRHRFVGDVTFNLGRIYEEEGDLDKAKSLYERTIAIWSKDKSIGKDNILTNRVKNRLAIVLLKQNKIDEAKIILTRVLKKDKLYSSTVAGAAVAEDRNDLAVAQLMSGDVNSARANFLKALDQKESLSTVFNLAVLESRYGDKAKAKSYLDRVNTLVQSDLSLDNLKNTDMLPDSFLKEYETLVEKQRPSYESPTYDTRGNVIINLEGRK
ncbi:MAG TPA: tetratricopeptide repeat protein, partial [Candidatus Melainabacteria bacterium]|nr:tetratricopeptide repeat protein [Candidatus Melainabacteria bacterium]